MNNYHKHYEKFQRFINVWLNSRESNRLAHEQENKISFNHKDDRLDYFELEKIFFEFLDRESISGLSYEAMQQHFLKMERNIRSVVMIISRDCLAENDDDPSTVKISAKGLSEYTVPRCNKTICSDSLYVDQLSVSPVGSGFFIENNTIATAAHVLIDPQVCVTKFRFVRAVIKEKQNSFNNGIVVPKANIYEAQIGHFPPESHGYDFYSDWMLLKVQPSYPDFFKEEAAYHSVVKYSERNPSLVKKYWSKEKVYAVGHSLGLPAKISFGGKIIKSCLQTKNFECNLMLLPGNSGSPVFYADTHELAGIYARGINKWTLDRIKNCLRIENHHFVYEGQECQMLIPIRRFLK